MKFKVNLNVLILSIFLFYMILSPVISYSFFLFLLFILIVLNFKKIKSINVIWILFILILFLGMFKTFVLENRYVYSITDVSTITFNVVQQNARYASYILFSLLFVRYVKLSKSKIPNGKLETILFANLFIFLILFYLFYIISLYNYDLYTHIRNIYFGTDINLTSNTALQNAGYFDRYSFLFLDANNCGYCVLAVCIFLRENYKKKGIRVFLDITMLSSTILTQSRGVLLSLAVYIFLKLFFQIKESTVDKTISFKSIVSSFCVLILIILLLLSYTDVMDILVNRVNSNGSFIARIYNNDDTRIEIWTNIINLLKFPNLIGSGYCLTYNGIYLKPHSDILRLMYGYGLVFFCLFTVIVYNNIKKGYNVFYLVPCILAMCLNSVLDEPRFLYIFIILFIFNLIKGEYYGLQNKKTNMPSY